VISRSISSKTGLLQAINLVSKNIIKNKNISIKISIEIISMLKNIFERKLIIAK